MSFDWSCLASHYYLSLWVNLYFFYYKCSYCLGLYCHCNRNYQNLSVTISFWLHSWSSPWRRRFVSYHHIISFSSYRLCSAHWTYCWHLRVSVTRPYPTHVVATPPHLCSGLPAPSRLAWFDSYGRTGLASCYYRASVVLCFSHHWATTPGTWRAPQEPVPPWGTSRTSLAARPCRWPSTPPKGCCLSHLF